MISDKGKLFCVLIDVSSMFYSFKTVSLTKVKFETIKDNLYQWEYMITKRVDGHCEFMITVNLWSHWFSSVVNMCSFYIQKVRKKEKRSHIGKKLQNIN